MKSFIKTLMIAFLALGGIPSEAMEEKKVYEEILFDAVGDDNLQIIQALIEDGVDVNAKDSSGWTALMIAAYRGRNKIVRYLLRVGADVNMQNTTNSTALILATENGHAEVVESLIRGSADIMVENRHGASAFSFAALFFHQRCCELIVEAMLGYSKQAYASFFCMKEIEGNIFDGIKIPVAERFYSPQAIGYERTLAEILKISNDYIKQALLAKYFPNEVSKGDSNESH